MTIRGLFFIGLFGTCSLLALAEPFAGIVAYVVHYHSYPERSWWGAALSASGVRYSFTISACLAAGTILNLGRLPYGRLIVRQEALYLAYLGWVVVSRQLSGQLMAGDSVDKMLKMAVFLLALTHVVVTPRRYDQLTWLLVLCALYLGYEGYSAPAGAYDKGRLNGIGGPDFADSNALGAHMVALLAIIGVRFLRSGWKGKLLTLVAGALAANTVVATRSRAAFLAAIAGGVAGLVLVPKGGRKKLWPLATLGILGSLTLVDAKFMERMGTLKAEKREEDASAQDRLMSWKAGLRMFLDHPLGVGPGNFGAYMGRYLANHDGRDAHNTYIRCAAELGIPGLVLFSALLANAFLTLARVCRQAREAPRMEDYAWSGYALQIALIMYLVNGIFGSFNEIEMLWWILLLPAALERVVANLNHGAPDTRPGALGPAPPRAADGVAA